MNKQDIIKAYFHGLEKASYQDIIKLFQKEEEDWAADVERQIKQGQFNVNLYKSQHTFTELLERYRNDGALEHIRSIDDVIKQSCLHFRC